MAYQLQDLYATYQFKDDSEQGASMKIPLMSEEVVTTPASTTLASLLTDAVDVLTALDDGTDASIERMTVHAVYGDPDYDTDLVQDKLNTVEDKALLKFQRSDGKPWKCELPAPDDDFVAGDMLDEQDTEIAAIIAALIDKVTFPGLGAVTVTLVEYVGGYRTRKKTRKRKPGVGPLHDASGI